MVIALTEDYTITFRYDRTHQIVFMYYYYVIYYINYTVTTILSDDFDRIQPNCCRKKSIALRVEYLYSIYVICNDLKIVYIFSSRSNSTGVPQFIRRNIFISTNTKKKFRPFIYSNFSLFWVYSSTVLYPIVILNINFTLTYLTAYLIFIKHKYFYFFY